MCAQRKRNSEMICEVRQSPRSGVLISDCFVRCVLPAIVILSFAVELYRTGEAKAAVSFLILVPRRI
jgi:hypothetical protein